MGSGWNLSLSRFSISAAGRGWLSRDRADDLTHAGRAAHLLLLGNWICGGKGFLEAGTPAKGPAVSGAVFLGGKTHAHHRLFNPSTEALTGTLTANTPSVSVTIALGTTQLIAVPPPPGEHRDGRDHYPRGQVDGVSPLIAMSEVPASRHS
ncbi:MAG: hypothetical protein RL077_820 [Verrucomicrobiota bacterium]